MFGEITQGGGAVVLSGGEREVTGLTDDSRTVQPGDLFIALGGQRSDGHRFLPQALAAGAAALLVERGRWQGRVESSGAALVEAGNVRDILGPMADRYYGHPSGDLDLFGVTGTNGKTSVTYLLESIFAAADMKRGVIGTVEYRWNEKKRQAPCTTPEAHELQRTLRTMADDGVEVVAMEVSSHALAQHRVAGCAFKVAIFTNLRRDHLDFHDDLEEYFLAKSRLFHDYRPEIAILNADDTWGEKILGQLPAGAISYGLEEGADCRALDVAAGAEGIRLRFAIGGRRLELQSRLLGEHNVYNILAAAAAASAYGLDDDCIRKGVERVEFIPGRFERIRGGSGPTVIVDYAHTPHALEHALSAASGLTEGRVILVFGCGGDRDRGKRPIMGEVAAAGADVTILTSDNPRSEEPEAIIGEIERGFSRGAGRGARLLVVADRRGAIREAIRSARRGDLVLIAGKGHEDYQILHDGTIPFSDREEARLALKERQE